MIKLQSLIEFSLQDSAKLPRLSRKLQESEALSDGWAAMDVGQLYSLYLQTCLYPRAATL